MQNDLIRMGEFESFLVKGQFNCVSDSRRYKKPFIPVVTEYVLILKKADSLTVPFSCRQEGCLSVPEIYGMVGRPAKVKIKALLEDGQEVRIKASGYLARTLLHEIEHLDGILFIDHIRDDRTAFYRIDEKGDLVPIDYDSEIRGNKALFPDSE